MSVEIFFSYSHKDEMLREELEKQLSLLKWQGFITGWHDRRIVAGQEWAGEIDFYLNTAQIILLLVSPDFMASDYCYASEMKRAVERHEAREAHVIPIILRPVDWHSAPFGKLQALPKDGKPVTSWNNLDEAFLDIVRGIRKAVEKMMTQLPARKKSPTDYETDRGKQSHLSRDLLFLPNPGEKLVTGEREQLGAPLTSSLGFMTINLPGVIKTLGESLYSDPSIVVRELIQNANDACILRKAEDPNVPDSEIYVHFDIWKRILVIEDNGVGMTEDDVKAFLTVIGSSKIDQVRAVLEKMGQQNLAARLIGRFGLGLLSAFFIGSRVEYVTLSYKEDAQPIWWQCDGGQEYRIGPAKDKTTPGTKVTISVDPKHIGLLNEDKLTELIYLYADLLSVPIYLNRKPIPVNVMSAPWHGEATEAEYRKFVAKRYPEDAILDIIPIDINEDDGKFKVGGVLFIPKQLSFIVREQGDVIVYAQRMFVCKNERTVLPEWAKFVRGIIESPNLHKTTSSEAILHDENLQRVRKFLAQAILDHLALIARENIHVFKEIVTDYNPVIKPWAIVSDELFERVKDIVLFQTDAGLMNLPHYFETSRLSKRATSQGGAKRYIFYFTTPGSAQTILFAAKGLRVIDAHNIFDDLFLEKYAEKSNDIVLKRLDAGGDFIFEELDTREHEWAELEEQFAYRHVEARVVRFEPEDFPAVMIFPETEPVMDQVDKLLADPTLSPTLKNLVREMWDERQRRKSRLGDDGILYINANNQVIQKLVDQNLDNYEIADILTVIHANAVMFSTQGTKMYPSPASSKKFFESNNRIIARLMTKTVELQNLRTQQVITSDERAPSPSHLFISRGEPLAKELLPVVTVEQTKYITCFVALPFLDEYNILLEALRDVLEVAPYFWQVEHADKEYFAIHSPEHVSKWIARAHCFAVDLSEGNENVMMELGHMYWGYPDRPLILLQKEDAQRRMTDLGARLRIIYPWGNPPDRHSIANVLRSQIEKYNELKNLKGTAHFLSNRLINADWIPNKVAEALAKHYNTVEDFVSKEPVTVRSELGPQAAPVGVIQAIQTYLREVCGLKER